MKVLWPWLGAGAATVASLMLALFARSLGLEAPVQVLVLALGVAAAAMAGRGAGAAASVLLVLAYNFWFTEPLFTLLVDDPQNYVVFALFLILGLTVGTLTRRLRRFTREQVLRAFSHDLRTPLTVIAGAASSLRAAGRSEVASLALIEAECRDLDRQVDNLLSLSRLEDGVKQELLPAEELLYSCRDRYASWGGTELEVETCDEVPLVRVDPALVEQALLNLVVNAERHAPGAKVTLSLVAGREVELRVSDRGPGVPEAEKSVVFRRFVRGARALSRGTGLGLALVAETARLHGGEAGVRDRKGGGAEFYVRLPRAREPR